MLPDLRIVIAAVISTFVLTVGVGFYASSRLINEPRKSTDSIAALDATPVNRIALSWPAPTRQPEPLALDFAVTAKALRNPVRDVSGEASVAEPIAEPQKPPVRTTATDLSVPPTEEQAAKLPEAIASAPIQVAPSEVTPAPTSRAQVNPDPVDPAQVAPVQVAPVQVAPAQTLPTEPVQTEMAPTKAAPAPVVSDGPKPVPEPEIRVAVQYPPILELPPELRAPIVPAPPAVAAVEPPSEAPATTGSVAEPPKSAEPTRAEAEDHPAPSSGKEKESEQQVASRPEPADANASDDPALENVPLPKAAPRAIAAKAPKKAVAKKPAARKTVRRPVRRAAPAIPNTVPNFFNLFSLQQPPR